MKKGCFFALLVLFTLAVGVVVYISRYHKEIIRNFARDRVVSLAKNEQFNNIIMRYERPEKSRN